MKIRSVPISLLISIIFSMTLTSCGAVPVSPTLTPLPTQTFAPVPTANPTSTPTETPAPVEQAESDIKEMSSITETGELLGVKNITTKIIISDTLKNYMKGIEDDDSYKDSATAWTEFTASNYYDLAVKKGGPDGTGLKITDQTTGNERRPTFEEFMQMAKEYQEGTRPGTDIQFTLKINNVATEGYDRVTQIFVPFATELTSQPLPENVIGLKDFDIVYFKFKDPSVTNVDTKYKGFGSNFLGSTLIHYRSIYAIEADQVSSLSFIESISTTSTWLAENRFVSSFNLNTIRTLSNGKLGQTVFKSVIKIIK